jgi:hypothetical protein
MKTTMIRILLCVLSCGVVSLCAMDQGGAGPSQPSTQSEVEHKREESLQARTAENLALRIWSGELSFEQKPLSVLPETQRSLVHQQLNRFTTISSTWPKYLQEIRAMAQEKKLLFARGHYLQTGQALIRGIGFSIAELLDHHRIPVQVPADGILDLSHKKINDMRGFERIAGLDNLRYLDLSNNQLTTLPVGVFKGLPKLRELHLYKNQLTTLPKGVFVGLNQLDVLSLFDNQLQALPVGAFNGLPELRRLHLYKNQLTTLPKGVFVGLNQLEVLSLFDNQLQVLPVGAFKGLPNLRWLHLHKNQLTTLPKGIFSGLTQLQWLDLSYNQLRQLPEGIFAGMALK